MQNWMIFQTVCILAVIVLERGYGTTIIGFDCLVIVGFEFTRIELDLFEMPRSDRTFGFVVGNESAII